MAQTPNHQPELCEPDPMDSIPSPDEELDYQLWQRDCANARIRELEGLLFGGRQESPITIHWSEPVWIGEPPENDEEVDLSEVPF